MLFQHPLRYDLGGGEHGNVMVFQIYLTEATGVTEVSYGSYGSELRGLRELRDCFISMVSVLKQGLEPVK